MYRSGTQEKESKGGPAVGRHVYAGRRTDAGGYLAFFSVAGARTQSFLNKNSFFT